MIVCLRPAAFEDPYEAKMAELERVAEQAVDELERTSVATIANNYRASLKMATKVKQCARIEASVSRRRARPAAAVSSSWQHQQAVQVWWRRERGLV